MINFAINECDFTKLAKARHYR